MKNKYYPTFEEFYKKIIGFFMNIEDYMDELENLLTLNFEIIKRNWYDHTSRNLKIIF